MTVNMDKDYEDLYLNLNCLLTDICKFLETKSLNLCSADKRKADALIERSRKQLQIIEKINILNNSESCNIPGKSSQETAEICNRNETERYVDMSKKPALPKKALIDEQQLYESKCPFQDLPAKEASQTIKYGTLSKRRKVFNILDVSTKIYAAIHEDWFLIYSSTKDLKPACALDLKHYEAKEDETDPNLAQLDITKDENFKKNTLNSKMTPSFKVFHPSSPEKKCYTFVATSHKEMLQWVININRSHDKALSATNKILEEENYEICQDLEGPDGEENIYNEIEMPCQSIQRHPATSKITEKDDGPAIPEKRETAPKNFLPNTPLSSSTESIISYEKLERSVSFERAPKKCSLNSFETSGDEEDQTYYELNEINQSTTVNVKEELEERKFNFDVPHPCILMDNALTKSTQPTQLAVENDLKNALSELPNSEKMLPEPQVQRTDEMRGNSRLLEKNVPKPLTSKPNVLSPSPWKPFRKNISSKSLKTPKISKNKSIRDSLKIPLKSEDKHPLEVSSDKNTFTIKETSALPKNYALKTSNKVIPGTNPVATNYDDSYKPVSANWSSKPHQGSSIVQIMRNRWSPTRTLSRSLETFSKNPKIEIFQASQTKETPLTDLLKSSSSNVSHSLGPIDSLIPDLTKSGKNTDEQPMVLSKASMVDEDSSKKFRKSPIVPVKPKKVVKKLVF